MIEVERALTAAMEKVEPWLTTRVKPNRPRVRPIPTNMEEANQVLAVARNLASRTSAPAGWNPNAPVVGFTTPNPLPHQLRGGALAALQLERAKQAEHDKKRQKMEQQKQLVESEKSASEAAVSATQSEEENSETARDPKRREIVHHEHEIGRSKSDIERSEHEKQLARRRPSLQPAPPPPPPQDISMNLSESSSDDEDD